MLKKILILLVLLMVTTSSSVAEDGLVGRVTVSTDYTFTNKWYKTMGESIPYLTEAKKVYKDQEFILYPVLVGYALDADSIARVKYDVKIFRPDSTLYYESYDVPALEAKISNPQFVMLAESLLEVNFEDKDPLGLYQIEVTLKDFNSKEAGIISTTVNLVEFKRVGGFTNDSIMMAWMQNYYATLNSEAAIDAFLYFANRENNDEIVDLTLSFFRELFNHNLYLIPYLEEEYFTQPDNASEYIGALLALLDYDQREFKMRLTPDEVKWFESMNEQKDFFEPVVISNPVQLDMLWAQFFASGSNEPIAKIVSALQLKKYDRLDQDSIAALSEEEKILYGTYKAAVWSLRANASELELVFNYLNYIYEHEKIPIVIKDELKIILNL